MIRANQWKDSAAVCANALHRCSSVRGFTLSNKIKCEMWGRTCGDNGHTWPYYEAFPRLLFANLGVRATRRPEQGIPSASRSRGIQLATLGAKKVSTIFSSLEAGIPESILLPPSLLPFLPLILRKTRLRCLVSIQGSHIRHDIEEGGVGKWELTSLPTFGELSLSE